MINLISFVFTGRPKISYDNPCEEGVPATDEEGSVLACGTIQDCPSGHLCTTARRSGGAVCCPDPNFMDNSTDSEVLDVRIPKQSDVAAP